MENLVHSVLLVLEVMREKMGNPDPLVLQDHLVLMVREVLLVWMVQEVFK